MKIQQNGISTERGERSRQTSRIGSEPGSSDYRTRRVGLDRVDVSRVGETAASLVDQTMQQRHERVSALAAQFQAGSYVPNLASLSNSILDHDSELDLSHA